MNVGLTAMYSNLGALTFLFGGEDCHKVLTAVGRGH